MQKYYHFKNLDRLLLSESLLYSIYMSHLSFAEKRGAKSKIIYSKILETESFQERFQRIIQNLSEYQFQKF